jgi:DNA-binding NarL/FixJ family response regulator
MSIKLMIVDDHDLVREGLRMTFEGTDVEVVAEAADGLEAFEKLKRQPVDVALVDIRMPRADGFQFLELLKKEGLKLPVVLMHSVQDGMHAVRRCQELGAKGLIGKDHDQGYLLKAVESIHAGNEVWNGSRD